MQYRDLLLVVLLAYCLIVCDAIRPKTAMRLKQQVRNQKFKTQKQLGTQKREGPDEPAFDDADQLQVEETWETAMDSSGINQIPQEIKRKVYNADAGPTLDWCVTQYLSQDPPIPDPNNPPPADAKLHFKVHMAFCLEGEQGNIDAIKKLFITAFDEYFANCKNYVVKPVVYFYCGDLAHYSYTLGTCTGGDDCRSFNIEPIVPINIQLKYNPNGIDECYTKYSIFHELLHRIYANKNGIPNSLTHDGTGSIWQNANPGNDDDPNVFHYSSNHFIPCFGNAAGIQPFLDEQVQSYWIMACRDKLGRGALENPKCYGV